MKILVTGAGGQLGQELVKMKSNELEIVGLTRQDTDITDENAVDGVVQRMQPDAIIHAAAYTAVDNAETDDMGAFKVNAVGTRNVVAAAESVGARVLYVSTDYVFDGNGQVPYGEYDRPNPRTQYGKTKLAGEVLTQTLSSRWFIVRTSWVYGRYGNNFVKTMLAKGSEGAKLQVVADQLGAPTYTKDLAEFLISLATTQKYGIYHASNSGSCSWYEFAKEIFEQSGLAADVTACQTDAFPRPAPRPAYSVLGQTAMRANGFTPLRPWQEALRDYLEEVHQ